MFLKNNFLNENIQFFNTRQQFRQKIFHFNNHEFYLSKIKIAFDIIEGNKSKVEEIKLHSDS